VDNIVTHTMEKKNTYKFLKRIPTKFGQDNPKKRVHLKGLGMDWRIILKCTIKRMRRLGIHLYVLGYAQLSVLAKMAMKLLIPYNAERSIIRRRLDSREGFCSRVHVI